MGYEEKILDTLTNIETSLKRIEHYLGAKSQKEYDRDAVNFALTGKQNEYNFQQIRDQNKRYVSENGHSAFA